MRPPSRRMPVLVPARLGIPGVLLLLAGTACLVCAMAWALTRPTRQALWLAAFVMALVGLGWWLALHRQKRVLRALALSRPDESIGSFARSFERREVDTWIIRAVYEQLQQELEDLHPAFPLRAEDLLVETLRVDPEDLEQSVMPAIAGRAGRSLENTRSDARLEKVRTVGELVLFLNEQPRLADPRSVPS